MRNTYEGCP